MRTGFDSRRPRKFAFATFSVTLVVPPSTPCRASRVNDARQRGRELVDARAGSALGVQVRVRGRRRARGSARVTRAPWKTATPKSHVSSQLGLRQERRHRREGRGSPPFDRGHTRDASPSRTKASRGSDTTDLAPATAPSQSTNQRPRDNSRVNLALARG